MKLFIRTLARGLCRIILRLRARPCDWAAAEPVLVIAPHQDDETLGCGTLIRQRAKSGLRIDVLFVTDGSRGLTGHPVVSPGELAMLRRAEAVAVMTDLGVAREHVHFLGAPDGELPHLGAAGRTRLIESLAQALTRLQPHRIYLPSKHDASTEHTAVFDLVSRAYVHVRSSAQVWEYPVWSWWRPWLLRPELVQPAGICRLHAAGAGAAKAATLRLYRTQTAPVPPWTAPALSADFLKCFCTDEEFFFRVTLPVAGSPP